MIQLSCQTAELSDLEPNCEFLQSPIWAAQKAEFGWKPSVYRICRRETGISGDKRGIYILLLSRRLVSKLWLAYVPFAPAREQMIALAGDGDIDFGTMLNAIAGVLKSELPNYLFLRFDLNWPLSTPFPGRQSGRQIDTAPEFSDEFTSESKSISDISGLPWESCRLNEKGLRKSSADIQPPDSVFLALQDSSGETRADEDLLAGMKSKTRYNIRLAGKKSVEIIAVPRKDYEVPAELEIWYEMYRETEARNKISLHHREYYEKLFSLTRAAECRLYMAKHEDDWLAGIIVTMRHSRARYLYGASSNVKRNLMPSYALQWKAIGDAKEAGCRVYDFFGIPPFAVKGHPMFGLYQFKTGFGGEVVHMPGAWDMPVKPLLYNLYRLIENIRMYYYRVFRKR